jgi:hypothetical protein
MSLSDSPNINGLLANVRKPWGEEAGRQFAGCRVVHEDSRDACPLDNRLVRSSRVSFVLTFTPCCATRLRCTLLQFLAATDARRYIDASRIARDILRVEPNNTLIKQYLPLLAAAQRSVTERSMRGAYGHHSAVASA